MLRADYLNWEVQKAQPPCREEAWGPQARPNLWRTSWKGRRVCEGLLNGGRAWEFQNMSVLSFTFPSLFYSF